MTGNRRRVRIAVVLAAVATVALAGGGSLDPAFGSGGIVWIDAGIESGAFLRDLAAQTDGRILAVGEYATGQVNEAGETISDWVIRRLDASGNADPGFGTGGLIRLFGTGYDNPWEVALDASGRAVIVGQISVRTVKGSGKKQTVSFPRIATLVRLNANGALDPAFGTGGVVKAAVPGAKESFGGGVSIQPDGRIVIAGTASFETRVQGNTTTRTDPFVARLLADGQLDTGFGIGGFAVDKRASESTGLVRAVSLQSTGQIVVAQERGPAAGWVVTRFSASGAIDSGFGAIPTPDRVSGMSIDRFDRIVATGQTVAPRQDIRVARYLADGSADTSFGAGGVATFHVYERQKAWSDPAFQPADDKIVFSAYVSGAAPSPYLATTVRLNDDGSLDSGYGTGGLATLIDPGSGKTSFAWGLALAPDGGILLAGGISPSSAWYVARYTPN